MFYRHDFLHPYLNQQNYYDKPLLSYWLVALFAFLRGKLTLETLRLPSAFAALLSISSLYLLGKQLFNKEVGLLAAWLLLTTYFFVFWGRVCSADMLNVAGSLLAVYWYVNKRDHIHFLNYLIFFVIVVLTSLCKGLVGAVVPFIAILVDVILRKTFKQHLRLRLIWAALPALLLYFLPFWASAHFGAEGYQQNGLWLVYKENLAFFSTL
jgi:4-amino-4-deoxy-L-arabinose transferase-like glycosyltransferase